MLPTLTEGALTLRPQREDDLPTLGTFLHDASVARWFEDDRVEELRAGDDEVFTILEHDVIAGWLMIEQELEPSYKLASVDLMLGPAFQDRGLGPAALRLILRWLFDEQGHHRCTIDPSAANARAIAAYRKVGFRDVGIMRQASPLPGGGFEDGLLMDLLQGELRE